MKIFSLTKSRDCQAFGLKKLPFKPDELASSSSVVFAYLGFGFNKGLGQPFRTFSLFFNLTSVSFGSEILRSVTIPKSRIFCFQNRNMNVRTTNRISLTS